MHYLQGFGKSASTESSKNLLIITAPNRPPEGMNIVRPKPWPAPVALLGLAVRGVVVVRPPPELHVVQGQVPRPVRRDGGTAEAVPRRVGHRSDEEGTGGLDCGRAPFLSGGLTCTWL